MAGSYSHRLKGMKFMQVRFSGGVASRRSFLIDCHHLARRKAALLTGRCLSLSFLSFPFPSFAQRARDKRAAEKEREKAAIEAKVRNGLPACNCAANTAAPGVGSAANSQCTASPHPLLARLKLTRFRALPSFLPSFRFFVSFIHLPASHHVGAPLHLDLARFGPFHEHRRGAPAPHRRRRRRRGRRRAKRAARAKGRDRGRARRAKGAGE